MQDCFRADRGVCMIEHVDRSPLLSVVIPVYNVEAYLDRCVESVLGQTYKNLEIILVDDGSTDCSGVICDKYVAKDARVNVIHKENGGLVSARKEGVLAARGKYATYVDSDDWIEKNMYEEMMDAIQKAEADVVTSGCIRDYGNHCIMEYEDIPFGVYEGECLRNEFWTRMINLNCFFKSNISIHIYNKIYERNLLVKYQCMVNDYINVLEDAACVYPCLLNAKKIAVTGKSYYHYCMRENSTMGSKRADEYSRFQVLFKGLNERFLKQRMNVPNIMIQGKFLQYYAFMLQCAENVVCYEGEILFPFGRVEKDEKVVVYGAGRFGCEMKDLLERKQWCNVVGWIDKTEKNGAKSVEHLV